MENLQKNIGQIIYACICLTIQQQFKNRQNGQHSESCFYTISDKKENFLCFLIMISLNVLLEDNYVIANVTLILGL